MKNKLGDDTQISISLCQASDPRWQALMLALQKELKQLYPEMPDLLELEHAQLLVAHSQENSTAIACVAMQAWALEETAAHAAETKLTGKFVEIKRLFVHPSWRGQGLAKRLLQELEALALRQQVTAIRLETGYLQHAAMALYAAMGYLPIPAYGVYAGQSFSRCFEKRLAPSPLL